MASLLASLRIPTRRTSAFTTRRRTPDVLRTLQSTRIARQSSFPIQRPYSTASPSAVEAPEYLSEGERKIFDKIKEQLSPIRLEVQDISGGCGSMYALDIVSTQFEGLPVIKQHRLVNKVLEEEMKLWHGVQLKTKASE